MSRQRLTRTYGIIGLLTIVLAVLSFSILAPYLGTRLIGDTWTVWYFHLAYGYLGIGVAIGGFVIGILTVQKRVWALKVNFFFQATTIGVILSSVYLYGWGAEYNFGLNPRNSMLILSSVILVLVVLTHRESVQERLSRIAEKHKYRLVIISTIALIIAFWIGLFDLPLSYSHITYGAMQNPLDENEEMYVIVRHTSPTLSANTPAFIDVYINMNYTYRQSHNLTVNDNQPDSFVLIFNDSDCGIPADFREVCIKTIRRVSDNFYSGSYYPIKYGRDGDYDITLAMSLSRLENRSTTENPIIHVNPTEASNEFRTFKMSIIIGIIAAAIGFITLFIQKDHADVNRSVNPRRDEPPDRTEDHDYSYYQ